MATIFTPLPPLFFARPALPLARALLGKILVHNGPEGVCAGRIVETEAYIGPYDKGAHTYGNRQTPRTQSMFVAGGRAYIYLIYGAYHCFNVTAGEEGSPEAVLVRALEPVAGLPLMLMRGTNAQDKHPRRGPGKLCRALAITRAQNGISLCGENAVFLSEGKPVNKVMASPRLNIGYAKEAQHYLWRYYEQGNPHVSGPRGLGKPYRDDLPVLG